MTKYAIIRDEGLVQHYVFEPVTHNFANSTLEVLTFDSSDQARKMLVIWPDAEVVPVKNNLHSAANCDKV
jgi:hypothetical protein